MALRFNQFKFPCLVVTALSISCTEPKDDTGPDSSSSNESQVSPDHDDDDDDESSSTSEADDTTSSASSEDTESTPPSSALCDNVDGECYAIDLLFVIDDSGSMAEEQRNLANNFEMLVNQLNQLKDSDDHVLPVSLNIMFTNSNMGHPLCNAWKDNDKLSKPALGYPVGNACLERLPDFSFDPDGDEDTDNAINREKVCTEFCLGSDYAPKGSKILHWRTTGSNIAHEDGMFDSVDEAKEALARTMECVGLQGIAGCGFEGTLEAMNQALNPDAPHNKGDAPFIREGATLAIVLLSDEEDCSVEAPAGYLHFSSNLTDNQNHKFWSVPATGQIYQPTSAICWNGGTTCKDTNSDGVYETCSAADKGVLHPISRYTKMLNDYWGQNGKKKNVVMLGILGVPEVTDHDPKTHVPTKGGVFDLEYRKQWRQADIPEGVDDTPENLDFQFGIGVGCKSKATGYAMPPVRAKEVCESLNLQNGDKTTVRCCIESICDENYSDAIQCLTGIIQSIPPIQ